MTRISFSAGLSNFFGEYSGVELMSWEINIE